MIHYIYIVNDKGTSYEMCYLLENSYKYKNLSLDDAIYNQELVNEGLLDSKQDNEQITTNTDLAIEQIIKYAERRSKESDKISNMQKIKDIRQNRIDEKNENRVKDSYSLVKKIKENDFDKEKVHQNDTNNSLESHEIELFNLIKQIGDSKNEKLR